MPVVEITSRNINGAFANGWWKLRVGAVEEDSRNGKVLVMKDPVVTTYLRPQERVLFDERRDANPVFHLVESIWMLAGRADVHDITPYNARYIEYAEKDGMVHGAYGYRWMNGFGFNQVKKIIDILKKDPQSRQAVLAMWDADICSFDDLNVKAKDKPCNTHIYFDGRQGLLNMTVCCRSNDMLWGAYGANVVHFSMLQELIAWGAGLAIGEYRQFSNNFHVYTELPMVQEFIKNPPYGPETDYYADGTVQATPMFRGDETVQDFLEDCKDFFSGDTVKPRTAFFKEDVYPLSHAYLGRKRGVPVDTLKSNGDWNVAFQEWLKRRGA